MDFTREPIIESIITPKEGCKLVVRSSKNVGQEEYFVDAIEVVSFANTFFYRSMERPKAFLVPATDYEVLEVREARMVLKNVGVDRSIKIAGGREKKKKAEPEAEAPEESEEKRGRVEKKKERRRTQRRKRTKSDATSDESKVEEKETPKVDLPPPESNGNISEEITEQLIKSPKVLSSLLPPPPKLISETIEKYKDDDLYKDVFYSEEAVSETEEPSAADEEDVSEEELLKPEEVPAFGSLETPEEPSDVPEAVIEIEVAEQPEQEAVTEENQK